MKLEEFRTTVAILTQRELAELSGVSSSTIQQVEAGKPFSKLSRGRILAGLSKHLNRQVSADEIDEFRERR